MSTMSGSLRLEVRVNGAVVATTGVEEYGVLTSILTWALHDPDDIPEHVVSGADPEADRAEWLAEELLLHVGGIDSGTDEHLDWFDGHLKLGDEVTVRLLPPGPIDAPVRRPSPFLDERPCSSDHTGRGRTQSRWLPIGFLVAILSLAGAATVGVWAYAAALLPTNVGAMMVLGSALNILVCLVFAIGGRWLARVLWPVREDGASAL